MTSSWIWRQRYSFCSRRWIVASHETKAAMQSTPCKSPRASAWPPNVGLIAIPDRPAAACRRPDGRRPCHVSAGIGRGLRARITANISRGLIIRWRGGQDAACPARTVCECATELPRGSQMRERRRTRCTGSARRRHTHSRGRTGGENVGRALARRASHL